MCILDELRLKPGKARKRIAAELQGNDVAETRSCSGQGFEASAGASAYITVRQVWYGFIVNLNMSNQVP